VIKRTSINELLEKHLVRKTQKQKQAFCDWLTAHSKQHHYSIDEQTYKKGHGKNLVIGSVEKADVILTAHYDTAPHAILPITTLVGSIPKYLLGQLLIISPIVLLTTGLGILISFFISTIFGGVRTEGTTYVYVFEVLIFSLIFISLWSWQMMFGFANQKNVNDNTSGVAVLIALLEDLAPELREKICFVFFDEEEKGLEGAKAFKRAHLHKMASKPLINFDCVGHGEHLMFITKKQFRESALNDFLVEATEGKALMKPANRYLYPSDQILFKNSIGVTAVHHLPGFGFYLSRLHSKFDVKFNEDNVEGLKEIVADFIENMKKEKR